jgi:hypothetical protein
LDCPRIPAVRAILLEAGQIQFAGPPLSGRQQSRAVLAAGTRASPGLAKEGHFRRPGPLNFDSRLLPSVIHADCSGEDYQLSFVFFKDFYS